VVVHPERQDIARMLPEDPLPFGQGLVDLPIHPVRKSFGMGPLARRRMREVPFGLSERLLGTRDEGTVEGAHGEVALEHLRHAELWVGGEQHRKALRRVGAVPEVALDGVVVGAHRLLGGGGNDVILSVPRHC